MIATHVIVRHSLSVTTSFVWSSVCGLLCGTCAVWLLAIFNHWGFMPRWWLAYSLLPALFGAPLMYLQGRRTQRRAVVVCAGMIYGMCYFIGATLCLLNIQPGGLSFVTPDESLLFIRVLVGTALICGVLNWLYSLFNTFLRFVIIEQDGTLCWWCGYRIGNPPISAGCPECGKSTRGSSFATGSPRQLLPQRVRLLLPCAVLSLIIILLLSGWLVNESKTAVFSKKFRMDAKHAASAMLKVESVNRSSRLVGSWEALSVFRPFNDDPSKVLAILYNPLAKDHDPAMQLQVLAAVQGQTSGQYMDPQIMCNLDKQQTEYVLNNDIPESLVHSLLAESRKHAAVRVRGSWFGQFVVVEPKSHFPKDAVD